MKIIKDLPKQPKWKLLFVHGKPHTGWCDYWEWHHNRTKLDLKKCNVPVIEATLELVGYGRGRSSAVFYFKDVDDDHQYEAAMQASLEIFKKSRDGKITGLFTFKKQGTQISITPYEE